MGHQNSKMENNVDDYNPYELFLVGYFRQNASNIFIPPEIQQLCITFYYQVWSIYTIF